MPTTDQNPNSNATNPHRNPNLSPFLRKNYATRNQKETYMLYSK